MLILATCVTVRESSTEPPVTTPLTCAGTAPTRSGYSKPYPAWLWTLSGLGHLQPPWATCSSISPNFISFSLYPLVLVLPLQFLTKNLSGLPVGPLQILEVAMQPSLLWAEQLCQPVIAGGVLPPSLWPSYGLALTVPCLPYVGNTRTVHSIPGGSHKSTGAKHLMKDKIKLQNPAHRRQSRFSASLRHPYNYFKIEVFGVLVHSDISKRYSDLKMCFWFPELKGVGMILTGRNAKLICWAKDIPTELCLSPSILKVSQGMTKFCGHDHK